MKGEAMLHWSRGLSLMSLVGTFWLVGWTEMPALAVPCMPPTLDRPCAYTPNAGSNDVSVIDTATDTVVATIPVGVHPNGVSIHPNGTRVYVTNSGDQTVSVIDTATNTVITPPIALGGNSAGSVVHPNGQRVYLDGGTGIFIIDTATNMVTDIIPIDGVHGGLALDPTGTFLYVTVGVNSIYVINTNTKAILKSIPVGNNPWLMCNQCALRGQQYTCVGSDRG